MKYFVESVTTYVTTGKTRKGAILQTVAKQFEHTIIGDDDALSALVYTLKCLVDAVNNTYKGKPLLLEFNRDAGYIDVKPVNNCNDNHVFSINYACVGATNYSLDMRALVGNTTCNLDQALSREFRRIEREKYHCDIKEGGEE